jgi:hypothetical protein
MLAGHISNNNKIDLSMYCMKGVTELSKSTILFALTVSTPLKKSASDYWLQGSTVHYTRGSRKRMSCASNLLPATVARWQKYQSWALIQKHLSEILQKATYPMNPIPDHYQMFRLWVVLFILEVLAMITDIRLPVRATLAGADLWSSQKDIQLTQTIMKVGT